MEENVQNAVTDSIGGGITGKPSSSADKTQQMWLSRLKYEKKCHKGFRKRGQEVEDVFRKESDDSLYVPLYWQVVSVEHSGVYSNQPIPDVRPRNNPQDPTMRAVAQLISKGLSYCVDKPSFDDNMHRTVDDYLAMALGVVRIKVDSVINTSSTTVPIYSDIVTGYEATGQPVVQTVQTGEEEQVEQSVGDQFLRWEYVPWGCFGWEPGNNWKNTSWVYFRHRMTQKEIIERFGRPVAATKDNESKDKSGSDYLKKCFDIYEIWCKKKKEVLFIAEGEKAPLEIIKDPLGLTDFFPMPCPMMGNLGSDELIPQPDYDYIEAYDVEINRLQERRMGLLEQIRASGAYDDGIPELSDMMENEDGEYTAISNLMQRVTSAGGVDGIIYHLPLAEKSEVLRQLTEQIQFVRAQVDEVLGISDIVRGVTQASETATAQEIKGRWVGVRLTRKRECVQYTVREMMRIMAQLLGSHITPENLSRMTQMQITEQMMNILGDDVLMEFSIDIETDSTVAKDEFREMQTKQEMLNGIAQYSQSVLPMVQQNAMPAGVASAILRSALAPYTKYDRNLEEELTTLPQTMGQLQQLNQNLQQTQQQLQQAQQESQQWQMVAQQLQQQATAAKSEKELADADKKRAEAAEIKAELPAADLAREDKMTDIGLKKAQTLESVARADDVANPKPKMNGAG
jgi:hypothetical protein